MQETRQEHTWRWEPRVSVRRSIAATGILRAMKFPTAVTHHTKIIYVNNSLSHVRNYPLNSIYSMGWIIQDPLIPSCVSNVTDDAQESGRRHWPQPPAPRYCHNLVIIIIHHIQLLIFNQLTMTKIMAISCQYRPPHAEIRCNKGKNLRKSGETASSLPDPSCCLKSYFLVINKPVGQVFLRVPFLARGNNQSDTGQGRIFYLTFGGEQQFSYD